MPEQPDAQVIIILDGDPEFFAMMPHMAWQDLSPGAYKLLGYIKAAAGESGYCNKGRRRMIEDLGQYKGCDRKVSEHSIQAWRTELAEQGYISWTEDKRTGAIRVVVFNRWNENRARFSPEFRQEWLALLEEDEAIEWLVTYHWKCRNLSEKEQIIVDEYSGAESAPVERNGAESAPEVVQKVHRGGAESDPEEEPIEEKPKKRVGKSAHAAIRATKLGAISELNDDDSGDVQEPTPLEQELSILAKGILKRRKALKLTANMKEQLLKPISVADDNGVIDHLSPSQLYEEDLRFKQWLRYIIPIQFKNQQGRMSNTDLIRTVRAYDWKKIGWLAWSKDRPEIEPDEDGSIGIEVHPDFGE